MVAAHGALNDLPVIRGEPHGDLMEVVERVAHGRTIGVIEDVVQELMVRAQMLCFMYFTSPRDTHRG